MNGDEHPSLAPLSQRLYRCLLLLYPRSYRVRDAAGMLYAFAKQLNEASERGTFTVALFWVRSALHALLFGLCERVLDLVGKRESRNSPRRYGRSNRGGDRIARLGQETRHALRRLARRPAFTVTVLLSLSLGIGSSTAVFSLVHAVLFAPLPYPDSQRLVGVWHTDRMTPEWGHAQLSYLFYRRQNRVFEDMGAYRGTTASVTGDGTPEELNAAVVSASTLQLLGVAPLLGRLFVAEEQYPGAEPTVVLGHRLWTRRFGADRAILGHEVQIDGVARTVIGVMAKDFQFPDYDTQLWLPMEIDPARPDRSYWNCSVIARLLPGTDIPGAQAEMRILAGRLSEAYPDPEAAAATLEEIGLSALVRPFKEDVIGDVSTALWILFAGVGCVLLIACANSANLFLVSAEERQHEVALRTALGASRSALFFTFLTESAILSLGGGLIGLGFAAASIPTLLALTPQQFPRLEGVGVHYPVLLFTLCATIIGSLLLGLMPGLHRRPNPANALTGSSRVAGGLRHRLVRNGLAVAQLALALVLMTGSGLMLRTFRNIRAVKPGFQPEGVLTFRVRVPERARETTDGTVAFYNEVRDRVHAVPGVQSVGAAMGLPLAGGGSMLGHSFEDFPPGPNDHLPNYLTLFVVPGYLEALRIPVVAGRSFEPSDLRGETGAVLVSAPLAARLWPNESPIGKRLTPSRFEETGVWYQIVGVVGPVRYERLEEAATEVIYYPLRPLFFSSNTAPLFSESLDFTVRAAVPVNSLIEPVTRAVWSVVPDEPVTRVRSMSDVVARASARTTFSMTLLLVAACVALTLGLIGLYGVISFLVSQRTREIGIRMALGADRGRVNRMVLGQALRLAGVGVLLGLVGTFALARIFKSMLFEVGATDPLTLTVVSLLLLTTAAAASYLPARRAARVDPLEAVAEL